VKGERRRARPAALVAFALLLVTGAASGAHAASAPGDTTSKFFSSEDGAFDVSGFLDSRYGFLPVPVPITEPAIGYGGALVLMFMDRPLGGAAAGFGRPNISMVGGLATGNGTRGVLAGDIRHWRNDRLKTIAGVVWVSANLDFFGVSEDALLDEGLRYNLEPKGVVLKAQYRIGSRSRAWAGLGYTFSATGVAFDAPEGTAGLPDFARDANLGGITPSLTFDSRDNIFTPLRGTYVDAAGRFFGPALGGDDVFENVSLVVMQYAPLGPTLFLGVRGDGRASFGDAPFYMLPYVSLRGAPVLRYQGAAVAQGELELRWQFRGRFSLVGFGGLGAAWNDLEHHDGQRNVTTGGGGFRYELARRYGLHAGLDVAHGPDETAIYVQVGSAWGRP